MSGYSRLDADVEQLLNRDDWPLRWQRKLGLAPRVGGMGLKRRALFFALFAWLPIGVWAFLRGHALPDGPAEPLLFHFGVNMRCLFAIPLLVLAEGMALTSTVRIATLFVRNRIVQAHQHGDFMKLMHEAARRRDASLPWIAVATLSLAWAMADPANADAHGMSWAVEEGRLGFGGWWFAYVARPMYIALLVGWLWRIILAFRFFLGISRLELSLVPTHPDGVAGLGFLEYYPRAYALVGLSISSVIASGWAHDVVYHAQDVHTLVKFVAALLVAWLLILLLPLMVFSPQLMSAKRLGKEEYGRIVGEHGRLVRERWINNTPVPDPELLDAPGIGPVADANSMYAAVTAMRAFPLDKAGLLSVVLPVMLPMIVVFALQIPLKDLLLKLLTALA